jgi:glycosyltransferase involved in cell wall biosynthesis
MTTTLRVVLDQLVAPTDHDLSEASAELARALVDAAPQGCAVEGIVPAGAFDADSVPGLAGVHRTALPRRELARSLQVGMGAGVGAGMIHSPTLLAPLVRHDRIHRHDQTVVTLWDLRAWEAPDELPRTEVAWHRAMVKRATKHADAVVVPTHAAAEVLSTHTRLGDRIRVIAGAPPRGFSVPIDDVGRRRGLGLPEGFVLLAGGELASDALAAGLAAVAHSGLDLPVVVIDTEDGHEPAVADLAAASGIPERRLHVRGHLDAVDRAAVLGAALAFVAPSARSAFPWRVLDALCLGVPVVAADSPVHREIIVDGGLLVDPDAGSLVGGLSSGLAAALGSTVAADRLAVLAADRGRAFSWREAADRVWQLHAEL